MALHGTSHHLSHPRYTKPLNWSHPRPTNTKDYTPDIYTQGSIKLNRWQRDGHEVREIARRWVMWEGSAVLDDWLRSVWVEVWRKVRRMQR